VLAACLALAPHARATPGVDDVTSAVPAAPVAQVVAEAQPVVEAAQAAVAQPVPEAQPAVQAVAAVAEPQVAALRHRVASLPAVRDVVVPAVHRVVQAAAPAVAVAHAQVSPSHSFKAASEASPAPLHDRTAGRASLPDARPLAVRSEPAAPIALPIRAKAPATHVARPQHAASRPAALCAAQLPGAVSAGAGGGGSAAAPASPTAHGPPLAAIRLAVPTQAPRSHVLLLRIERPD
jgi:hypothetical protein